MDSKGLAEEVRENIKTDRKRLTDLYTSIKKLTEGAEDTLGLVVVSEHLVKITDSLTKQNSQLLELAKLNQKISPSKPKDSDIDTGFDSDDTDDIYDEISQN